MNEFESSTEPTDIEEKLHQVLAEFECGRAEPSPIKVKGDNVEEYETAAEIGRGMTQSLAFFPWEDPIASYSPRRVRIPGRVKKGPGKGQHRSY